MGMDATSYQKAVICSMYSNFQTRVKYSFYRASRTLHHSALKHKILQVANDCTSKHLHSRTTLPQKHLINALKTLDKLSRVVTF